ncbi:MAG: MATE family efflux transporter [Candidatus Poribacteria bacterium]|nr:MATE family efflux transporter [Candidatus Poribacteria bacterium]
MQAQKARQFTDGAIIPLLIDRTLPMILGILAIFAFNLVDTFFVARLGTDELAAMGFSFPIVFIIGSISMGIGTGATAVIARAIGTGDHRRVQRLSTDALILSVAIVGALLIAGYFTIDPMFTAMGASPEVLIHIRDYMTVWYAGIIFLIVPMTANNIIRATGDTKTPGIMMLVAALLNFALDPLMIFGWEFAPRMGIAGAALATVISRAFTLVFAMWVLYYRDKMISCEIPKMRDMMRAWKDILHIGLPTAGTNLIVPMTTAILTGIVAVFGKEAVAGFGVASRIETFALTVVMALSFVIAPYVAQNWGAGKHDRVRDGAMYANRFAMGWGLFVAMLLALFATPIARLFDKNPDVIHTVRLFLWMVPISYGLQGVIMVVSNVFNALHLPFRSAALAFGRMIGLNLPLAYVGAKWYGLYGVFGAACLATVLVGLAAFIWGRWTVNETNFVAIGAESSADG